MTSHPLINALETYMAVNDPWADGYADRLAAATVDMLADVRGLAVGAGHPDATRVWKALEDERAYAARNLAAGDRMHRKVPNYAAVVHAEHAILTADRDGIPDDADKGWCETCRRMREVMEVDHHAGYYSGHHEVEVTATHLACGHTSQSPERVVGPAPGGEAAAEAIAGEATRRRLERAAAWQD